MVIAALFLYLYAMGLQNVVLSYDIVCKYHINFWKRVGQTHGGMTEPLLPHFLKAAMQVLWLVPKMHLAGHQQSCQQNFSFNLHSKVGRMSGELVETLWSALDWYKYQTQTMGLGFRREVLSDLFNNWNFKKRISMSAASPGDRVVGTDAALKRRSDIQTLHRSY